MALFLSLLLATATVPRLTPAEVHDLVRKGEAVVVDVRGSVPYELAHIEGAVWMPLGLMNQRAGELPNDKLIVTYCTCKSEETSLEGAAALQKLGFERVAVLLGGYPAWVKEGLPTGSTRTATPAGRLAPAAGVTCDRNDLTSHSGEVTRYRRKRGKITLTLRTDADTTETITVPDALRHHMIVGTPMTAADWNRIEIRKGVVKPAMRAIAWVCSDGRTWIDWRPGQRGTPAE